MSTSGPVLDTGETQVKKRIVPALKEDFKELATHEEREINQLVIEI